MTSATDKLHEVKVRDPVVRTPRRDRWWIAPLATVFVLGAFVVYGLWVTFSNDNYYSRPYVSPFYSPCLAAYCDHPSWRIIRDCWTLSPALLILPIPFGFR